MALNFKVSLSGQKWKYSCTPFNVTPFKWTYSVFAVRPWISGHPSLGDTHGHQT